jgi:hypothetical protein
MGSADSAGSVVDPVSMRVHGLDGLRVVDASAMPYITNGNIYAPVMMMAEKAADLILGPATRWPRTCERVTVTSGPSAGSRRDRRAANVAASGISTPDADRHGHAHQHYRMFVRRGGRR